MTFSEAQVRSWMTVVDTRGTHIGRVQSVDPQRFVVDRGDSRWTTVEYSRVRAIVGDQVVLDTGPDLDRGVGTNS